MAERAKKGAAVSGPIGFVGVGRMGTPMVGHLLRAGHAVLAWDNDARARGRARTAGAQVARSLAEVAAKCGVVMVCLPTPQIVREVALGEAGLCSGQAVKIYVDLSTSGAGTARDVAAALQARGIAAVDSPVTGGVARAKEGTLAVIVSGAPASVRRVRNMLDCFGEVHVVGDAAGQAQTLKVINNLLGAVALVASSEAFVMGVKAGLDPDAMLAVINSGSGRNSATLDKFPKSVLTRSFDFGFPISLYCKDIHLALAEAERLGVNQWMGSAAAQFYDYARYQGGGTEDFTAIIKYFEAMAGVEVVGREGRARKRAR
jgi:3-hydroxyisobutyrate dehydrogenase-like beta-hydroxyacid dehydrogenase